MSTSASLGLQALLLVLLLLRRGTRLLHQIACCSVIVALITAVSTILPVPQHLLALCFNVPAEVSVKGVVAPGGEQAQASKPLFGFYQTCSSRHALRRLAPHFVAARSDILPRRQSLAACRVGGRAAFRCFAVAPRASMLCRNRCFRRRFRYFLRLAEVK